MTPKETKRCAQSENAIKLAFKKEMAGREYGHEETESAYYFFRQGWIAHIKGPRHIYGQEADD